MCLITLVNLDTSIPSNISIFMAADLVFSFLLKLRAEICSTLDTELLGTSANGAVFGKAQMNSKGFLISIR